MLGRNRLSIFFRLLSCCLLLTASQADALAQVADGSARIRLDGNLAAEVPSQLSVLQIEAIGTHEVEAYNPYEKRSDRYTGVWLKDLVTHLGASSTQQVTTSAIDDYVVTFKAFEWQQQRILIATRVNGQYIGFAQKGPLRIVYPDFDRADPVYQANLPKWMWMITRISFE